MCQRGIGRPEIVSDAGFPGILGTKRILHSSSKASQETGQQISLQIPWESFTAWTDLRAAVVRQGLFVSKMNSKLWIRSPGLYGTVSRARNHYEKFFSSVASYPDLIFVLMLDVDLVWHTHQLRP